MARGLAIIGNCSYSALLKEGSVEWLCWPRPDSSFVFGPLLDREKGGAFAIEGVDATEIEQAYFENTNVLRTVFRGEGGEFELIDFAPRFSLYDRFFKPSMLIRILRPLSGEPRARVRCRPTYEYGLEEIGRWRASNHIEFTGFPTPVRLTTNVPLTYVEDERPVPARARPPPRPHLGRAARGGARGDRRALPRAHARLLAPLGEGHTRAARLPARGRPLGARAQAPSVRGHGRAPRRDDDEPARAPGSGRNWDYRFCWLRDAYFTLNALERLGHSEEMEHFLEYLRNLAEERGGVLQPAYRINGDSEATERELEHLSGFNGDGPVRIGNQAFEHVQNDVYGEMVLAVSRLFLDTRFVGEVPRHTAVEMIQGLVDQMDARLEEPDAGLWEFRGKTRLHSFSVLMHWAGSRRAARGRRCARGARARAHARGRSRRGRASCSRRGAGTRRSARSPRSPASPSSTRRCSWPYISASSRRTIRARRSHVDAIRNVAVGRRRASPPVHGAGRLRPHGGGVHGVHVLARRGARAHRPHGRGARALRPAARASTTGSASTPRTSSRTRSSRAATSRRRTATSG